MASDKSLDRSDVKDVEIKLHTSKQRIKCNYMCSFDQIFYCRDKYSEKDTYIIQSITRM
jgi:hypothetical protein